MVSGRDQTKLVNAMDWQVAAVRDALGDSAEFPDVPITAALCFIDAEFPLFGNIELNQVHVRGLGGTVKLVSAAALSIRHRGSDWRGTSPRGCPRNPQAILLRSS